MKKLLPKLKDGGVPVAIEVIGSVPYCLLFI